MSQGEMTPVDVYLEPQTEQEIEDLLEYGESKSGWIRDACRQKLNRSDDN